MIVLDTNPLMYAHRAENPFHAVTAKLVTDLAASKRGWAIPWPRLRTKYPSRSASPPDKLAVAYH